MCIIYVCMYVYVCMFVCLYSCMYLCIRWYYDINVFDGITLFKKKRIKHAAYKRAVRKKELAATPNDTNGMICEICGRILVWSASSVARLWSTKLAWRVTCQVMQGKKFKKIIQDVVLEDESTTNMYVCTRECVSVFLYVHPSACLFVSIVMAKHKLQVFPWGLLIRNERATIACNESLMHCVHVLVTYGNNISRLCVAIPDQFYPIPSDMEI